MSKQTHQQEVSSNQITTQQKGTACDLAGSRISVEEMHLVNALRNGDEVAFALLLDYYNISMLRHALLYVPNHAVAEEVVQETWMAVFRGLSQFKGHSSLKTWIFRILTNRAQIRGQFESRSVPFSSLATFQAEPEEPTIDSEWFPSSDHSMWPGQRVFFLQRSDHNPENYLLAQEIFAYIQTAIEALPPRQRKVIILRDIEGWTSDEASSFFGVTETNQRVLLHRARNRVRQALEQYFDEK